MRRMFSRFLRTMLRHVPAAAVIALVGVAALQARTKPQDDQKLLDDMIGQMIIVGFPGRHDRDPGVAAVREQLAKGVIGGVALFSSNVDSKAQLRNLIGFLKNARSNPIPFIAVDQEGGKVQRLNSRNGFRHYPSARAMAKNPKFSSPEAAERLYGRMAGELADTGFNMNFAPVLDLDLNARNPVIGRLARSYGDSPDEVTSFARTFIEAHRATNVVAVGKHFPGHGSSTEDSHWELADISQTWREIELEPYRRLAADGALDAVMVGHLYHPRFSDLEDQPASLSSKAVRALRNKNWIGFGGVALSDDMEMGGVNPAFSFEDRIVKAVTAGIDIVVFSNVKSEDPELGVRVHEVIARAVREGRISRLRIEQAYGKIMLLKRRLMQKDLAGKW
ncbi:MAG: glycoside hydrolase family 3 protein [Methyloceanibacter sp.]